MSDITAVRGDTESYLLTVVDATEARVDLTAASLWFTVKQSKSQGDPLALIQKTISNGITLSNQGSEATKGQATIAILPADTAKLLAPHDYYYDVQFKSGATITTVVDGTFSLEEDVTATTS